MSTVDRFIKENELNESAAARLRGATKEVRDACIDQGWNVIENARNASAVVISRIKKIEDGKKNKRSRSRSRQRSPPPKRDRPGDEFRDGDWYCPSCGAHNYSRRTDCFKCGAKKPTGRSKSRSRSRQDMCAVCHWGGFIIMGHGLRPFAPCGLSSEIVGTLRIREG